MSETHSQSASSDHTGRMGLCLAGGGITGAMYEVGCLAALEETFEGFRATDFDVFVGSSSGSVVAAALAGGVPALRLYRALLDPADDMFPLQRHHLLRFDSKEWRRVWASAFGAVRHIFSSATNSPLDIDVWNELDRFTDSLPAGIFTMDAFEHFLADVFRRRGIPRTFSEMPRPLCIVANDLDAGDRAVFGQGDLAGVPLARAVVASAAIPILFAPVRVGERDFVDGGLGEVAHADLAVERGCDLVLVINPMVPVETDPGTRDVPTGHGRRKRVRDKGLLWVYNQSWRMRTQARFLKSLDEFRVEHPEADILLLEPRRDDATMFMYSPMNFAARRVILEVGFRTTLAQLKDEASPLRRALEAKGLSFRSSPGR